ncbi:MAG: type II toxin-antitoxin system VapC family toxin [Salinarimonas sp.]
MIVLDASAAVQWASDTRAPEIAPPRTGFVAPDLFVSEVQNAGFKYLRGRYLSRIQADSLVTTALRMVDRHFPAQALAREAWALAIEYDHSPYDMLYLALAVELDTEVLTADVRFARKLRETIRARHVRLVGPAAPHH